MESKDIYIVGAGTYGEVMFELAQLMGYKIKGFYDEDENKINSTVMGVEVLGKFSELEAKDITGRTFIVAIGDNKVRERIMDIINFLDGETPTLIHPSAVVSPSALVGKGVYIHANAYIWTKVVIGNYCILSPGVVIAHHTNIGIACLISTLTGVGASINIESGVFIGMGSTIVTGVSNIGGNSTIGAGAVVLKNTDSDCIYAGIPARKLRSKAQNV